jgi:uncharacterized membrane protein
MYISLKYVIFYTLAGGFIGYIGEGDKRILGIGACLAAILGFSFGIDYAILSAIEYALGFYVGSIVKKNRDSNE